jgi:2,3-dihydroxyphenylpropionate 1,2-dioxygenase
MITQETADSGRCRTMMACASHAPIMYCYARAPSVHEEVDDTFARVQREIEQFDPELVVIFGPDHYTSLFRSLAPPFTVAAKCEAIDDIGGHAGKFNVPDDLAIACVENLAENGLDAAISYDLKVDHGISQTLHRLTGSVGRYPVIAIIINTMTAPLPPFHRSRLLGTLVGRFVKGLGKRTLFLGSGGLSHNPKVIYPDVGTGEANVTSWQMNGPLNDLMTREAWLRRLDEIHRVAAVALAEGNISAADCCFNEAFDRQVIDLLAGGRFDEMDRWDNSAIIAEAGIGAVEAHAWLAAAVANREAGGELPTCDIYAQAIEYGIALGIMHAGPKALAPQLAELAA